MFYVSSLKSRRKFSSIIFVFKRLICYLLIFLYPLEGSRLVLPFNIFNNCNTKTTYYCQIIGLNSVNIAFLLPMNLLISFGICLTPKPSKYVTVLQFIYNGMWWVTIDIYSSRFITYATSFILGKLPQKKHLQIYIYFDNIFFFKITQLISQH